MTKGEARALARLRLAALSTVERARASAAIARDLWTVPEVAGARVLLLFASLPEEVDTDPIAAEARRRGVEVVYPRSLTATRGLALHRVAAGVELDAGGYGIREPGAGLPAAAVAEIDAALVPGLAWDRAGGRLGRGAGYFDRLFAHPDWRAFRCGLFFADQELAAVPTDPWDAGLDAVVTEGGVWRR